jgi:hypothetical protein
MVVEKLLSYVSLDRGNGLAGITRGVGKRFMRYCCLFVCAYMLFEN